MWLNRDAQIDRFPKIMSNSVYNDNYDFMTFLFFKEKVCSKILTFENVYVSLNVVFQWQHICFQ